MVKDIGQWLYTNKEGIIIGGLVGLGYAIYLGSTGADLNFALKMASSDGVITHLIDTSSTVKDVAITKVGTMFIFIGAIIGGIVDHIFYPNR